MRKMNVYAMKGVRTHACTYTASASVNNPTWHFIIEMATAPVTVDIPLEAAISQLQSAFKEHGVSVIEL